MRKKGVKGARSSRFNGFGFGLLFSLAVVLGLALLTASFTHQASAASAAYTANSHQITINSTGDECSSVGTWDQYSQSCTLNTDITDTTVWIVSSGVTLNGNSHLVSSGADVHYGVILDDNTTGITVENLNASGFVQSGRYSNDDYGGYGIYIKPTSSGNTLSSNTVTTCNNGIGVDGANNTLSGNTASTNNFYGIILNGPGNSLSGNTASANKGPQYGVGIVLNGSGSILSANTVGSNPGSGIVVGSSSSGDSISGNTVDSNGLGEGTNPASGIQLWGSNDTVENNVVDYNFTGIFASGSGDTISGNTTSSNKWGGISSAGYSLNNSVISGNTAASNGANGISLYSGSGDTVSNNNTSSNNVDGYFDQPGMSLSGVSNSTISGNISNANGTGISVGTGYGCNTSDLIENNTTDMDDTGIGINNSGCSNSQNLTVSGNTASSNSGHANNDGFYFSSVSGSVISGNTLDSNGNNGIKIDGGSAGNSIIGNTISSNKGGGLFFGYPSELQVPGNIIYHNDFIGNWIYQTANDGSGAVTLSFNLAAPIGGNYWSDFSTPAQGCTDANGDGFCDSPYNHTAASPDYLPLTQPVASGKPPLTLDLPSPSWASLSDYQAGVLSVTWTVNNTGANEAWSVQLTGSTNTGGVTLASTLPATVGTGDILPGSSGSVTLRYNVPAGVGSWVSTLSGSAQDGVGTTYTYP
ncbi:MAG: right-handed parallel beta-helix repeat-containing protein [Actinobacteria bacterium]|nr:right-handed parallel beta-helix repeat-containing protein [Actinomycetota bacterium]